MPRLLGVLVLSLVGSVCAHAEERPMCRQWLKADEVSAAIGPVKLVTAATNGRIAAAPATSKPVQVCSWAADDKQANVNMIFVPSLPPTAIAQGLRTVEHQLGEMRVQRANEERQDFGDIHCSSLSNPSSKVLPRVTGCVGDAHGTALYVSIATHRSQPAFDVVKRLYDAAAARFSSSDQPAQ
jgi:hypothetical protein